jgi:hypothetical protein
MERPMKMNTEQDPRDDALSKSLKALPDKPAPPTLMPRVMEAVAARERRPWHRPSWRHVFRDQRLAAAAVVASLALLPVAFFLPSLVPDQWLSSLGAIRTVTDALGTASAVICEGCARWAATGASLLIITMYLTCLALGTAAYQLARRT